MSGMRFSRRTFVVLGIVATVVACDQDPFGFSHRRVAGPYQLERFDEGGVSYYLHGPGEVPASGGGLLEGTVTELGWTDSLIVARRRPTFGGDSAGWMLIDVRTARIEGPLSDSSSRSRAARAAVRPMPVDAAWRRL
jgi:hypothetical protein